MNESDKKYPEVKEIIPQREPMIMIDDVMECSPGSGICRKTISEDDPFIIEGNMPRQFLIEMIAQSVAAINGISFREKSSEPVPEGYLVGVKNFQVQKKIPCGRELQIKVTEESSLGNISIFFGEVFSGDDLIASGSLKFYLNT